MKVLPPCHPGARPIRVQPFSVAVGTLVHAPHPRFFGKKLGAARACGSRCCFACHPLAGPCCLCQLLARAAALWLRPPPTPRPWRPISSTVHPAFGVLALFLPAHSLLETKLLAGSQFAGLPLLETRLRMPAHSMLETRLRGYGASSSSMLSSTLGADGCGFVAVVGGESRP